MQGLWQGLFRGPPRELPQHRADADKYQIGNGDHNCELDHQNRDAEKDFDDSQGYAGRGQNDWDAHCEDKNCQKYDSHYSQYVGCFFHRSFPSSR
jgi:hypothetical protein